MKSLVLHLAVGGLLLSPLVSEACTCACANAKDAAVEVSTAPAPAESPAPVGPPLRGVVVEVVAEKSALLVKHEEIPGVMRAMTMLLKVDANTLRSSAIQKNAVITGLLVRRDDGWWLADVKAASQ